MAVQTLQANAAIGEAMNLVREDGTSLPVTFTSTPATVSAPFRATYYVIRRSAAYPAAAKQTHSKRWRPRSRRAQRSR